MKKSDELKQKRTAIDQKIKALAEKADLTQEERDTLESLTTQAENLTREIQTALSVEESIRRLASSETPEAAEVQNYSFARAIRGLIDGNLTGLEREMDQEARRENPNITGLGIPSIVLHAPQTRADLAAASSPLVTTQNGPIIDALRAKLVLAQAGALYLTGLTGNYSFPRMAGGAAVWEGENTDADDFGAALDSVPLNPKRLAAFQNVSKLLVIQGTPAAEMLIRNDMIRAIANAVDAAGLAGADPAGILNTSGIGATVGGATGAAPTYQNLVELEAAVATKDADLGSLFFVTNPKVRGKLRNTVVGTDQRMIWGNDNLLLGYNTLVTSAVPSNLTKSTGENLSAIIFGNFNDLVIGQFGGLDIIADQYTLAKKGQIALTVNSYWGIAVRHPESFAAMKDAVTTA